MPGRTRPGDPRALGVTWLGDGCNVAVISTAGEHDGQVQLCRLPDDGPEERFNLYADPDGVWHARIDDLRPGDRYGFRASGTHDPAHGLHFDPARLLVDPYARALTPAPGAGPRDRHSVVVDGNDYDWGDDRPPNTPLADTVLYETHVRGLTRQHPAIPQELRGTYAGLAHPEVVAYLQGLGITAVELMPVHAFVSEPDLLGRGLVNYWGYSTLGYFAPHDGYSSSGNRGQQVSEFRDMVRALHAADLEVVLDVVFNHTAEGAPSSPTLCWRGLADDIYYRHEPDDAGRYLDTTGTGNSLAAGSPEVLRMVLDSLRYWVQEMHVDGFRFDLAVALSRETGPADRMASFFDLLYQEPVLSRVKLIAEPWDLGNPDGYQVGRFPPGWSEWNDHFRDQVRDVWHGAGRLGDLATRLSGSSDLYGGSRRAPTASINYVCCHDGKTLADVNAYQGRHNTANRPDDEAADNGDHGANFGVEGPTTDPTVVAARQRATRAMLLSLLTAQGVPMLLGGDERGRTQQGNTNAYCQDNPISWYDWAETPDTLALTAFTRLAITLRRSLPALRRESFITGLPPVPAAAPDVVWAGADGGAPAWDSPNLDCIIAVLSGAAAGRLDKEGQPMSGPDVLLVASVADVPVSVLLPAAPDAGWTIRITSNSADGRVEEAPPLAGGSTLTVPPQTMLMATSS